MAPVKPLDAYCRSTIRAGALNTFLYAAHTKDANYIQLGFGTETADTLQRSHIAGPTLHEFHIPAFMDWLETGTIAFVDELPYKQHPISSTYGGDVIELLKVMPVIEFEVGRFAPLLRSEDLFLRPEELGQYGKAVEHVQIKAFGHPLDWDCKIVELLDGRFCWFAYDHEIKRIRLGIGFYDDANERQFGTHDYALGVLEAPGFIAECYAAPMAPIQFMGLPPRWPAALNPFVFGEAKQKLAVELLRLADMLWPEMKAA